jgi:gamma-glutamyltranspeptidase/glutathione hydrolase
VVSNPPPGSGCCLVQMLQALEHFDLGAMGPGSTDYLDTLARVMGHCHADRNRYLADPEFADVPVDRFLSLERAAEIAGRVRDREPPEASEPQADAGTTHLSVADAAGNAVSLTHTLGTGSGVVTPGLGFVYNNSMKLADTRPGRINSMAPGKARTTGMVPTMLMRDGKPEVVVGAQGGSVIISAVLQSIVNMADFAMSPAEAVAAPRIHCESGPIHAEARIEGAVVAGLEALGHEVRWSALSYDPVMAKAHAVRIGQDDWQGGADPRHGGGVAFSRA